jgi:hypothetical protein
MGVGGQHYVPAALPPGMIRYPLYRRLGGSQGRSGRVLKISPPPGFDARTVQLVANRYTDCAIPAHVQELDVTSRNTLVSLMYISAVAEGCVGGKAPSKTFRCLNKNLSGKKRAVDVGYRRHVSVVPRS